MTACPAACRRGCQSLPIPLCHRTLLRAMPQSVGSSMVRHPDNLGLPRRSAGNSPDMEAYRAISSVRGPEHPPSAVGLDGICSPATSVSEGVSEGSAVGLGTVMLHYGQLISAASARRIACDCKLIPAVMGADSEPLDVGRAQRTVPLGVRRALVARDHGCAFPGCDPATRAVRGDRSTPFTLVRSYDRDPRAQCTKIAGRLVSCVNVDTR